MRKIIKNRWLMRIVCFTGMVSVLVMEMYLTHIIESLMWAVFISIFIVSYSIVYEQKSNNAWGILSKPFVVFKKRK